MRILAIDPGPDESAYIVLENGAPHCFAKLKNEALLGMICRKDFQPDRCVIEKIASFGMPVGAEVFETVFWSGRFAEAFGAAWCDRITRNMVKNHLCHSSKAKDGNVRQAIIDRFGGKEKGIGRKANPGPLYGISADAWSALAVGLTWFDNNGGIAK